LSDSKKIQERFLYKIWANQSFNRTLISNGVKIQVLDPGIENKVQEGPDFRNSRIKIGNITFKGDVEIDNFQSDWHQHGHNFNKRYNKVILHVVFKEDPLHQYVISRDGRKIHTLGIGAFVDSEIRTAIQNAILKEKEERLSDLKCSGIAPSLEKSIKYKMVEELGIARFRKKCDRMLYRLKEIVFLKELNLKEPVVKYDFDEKISLRNFTYNDFKDKSIWEQLFYESIFEALGYTNNKEIMKRLAISISQEMLKQLPEDDNLLLKLESVFFNIAGLINISQKSPDENSSIYARSLFENWEGIKSNYDGIIFNKTHWHFAKLRPHNFPTIRIAGGVRIIKKLFFDNMIENIFTKFEKITELNKVIKYLRGQFIVKAEGYWKGHYIFGETSKTKINYFVGISRADDIIVNILLPISAIYFELFGKNDLSKKVFNLYLFYRQRSDNQLVNKISNSLELNNSSDKSVMHQGMIELYRNYCTKDKCLKCEIGKQVFN